MPWEQFYILVLTMSGFFLTVCGLFFWNRSEANADRREVYMIVKAIQDEMKDFHGKLERQDAEFKAHIMHLHGK